MPPESPRHGLTMGLPGSDPVHKVSIIPRGIGALGYTMQRPIEDRFLMTRDELQNKMVVVLGGRAAEQLVFAQVSTGVADDLAKVSDIARAMVTRYGMHESLANLSLEQEPSPLLPVRGHVGARNYSEHTAQAIDDAVRELVAAAYQRAQEVLTRNRALLDKPSVCCWNVRPCPRAICGHFPRGLRAAVRQSTMGDESLNKPSALLS